MPRNTLASYILFPSAHKILENLHIYLVSVEYHYCYYMKCLPHPLIALWVQVSLVSKSLGSWSEEKSYCSTRRPRTNFYHLLWQPRKARLLWLLLCAENWSQGSRLALFIPGDLIFQHSCTFKIIYLVKPFFLGVSSYFWLFFQIFFCNLF